MREGERLQAIRFSKGLTLKEASKILGVELSVISRGEKTKYISSYFLKKACIGYNISPSYILGLNENQLDFEPKWAKFTHFLEINDISPREARIIIEENLDRVRELREEQERLIKLHESNSV